MENNEEVDGFNPNEVPVLLQLREDDPLKKDKCELWRKDGSLPCRRMRICIGDNENSRTMLSVLRIVEADAEDFAVLSRVPTSSYRSIRDASMPINSKNEIKAMQLLISIVDDYLSRYPTSYKEDFRRLESNELAPFSNERHAVIQIKGEKEVLLFYKDFAETSSKIIGLECSDAEFESTLNDVARSKHAVISQHCKGVLWRLRREENTKLKIGS